MKYKFIGTEQDLVYADYHHIYSESGGYFERYGSYSPNKSYKYSAIYFYDNGEVEFDEIEAVQDLIDKGLMVENE